MTVTFDERLKAVDQGMLNDLVGDLVAPRCMGIVEYPDKESWLWLEDIGESGDGVWSLERYGLAARHLGQFNGAYGLWQARGSSGKRLQP